jgi:hypothetical protein
MEISLADLRKIITSAVEVGVENYMKAREPETDMLKQADAKRYLSKVGIQPVMLKKWVDCSLLTPVKTGSSQNAPVMYSLAEIKELIFTMQTHQQLVR